MNWILRVAEFIEQNLRSEISIEDLAIVSGYSVRHFQRSFKEASGDSVMEYVRGRRLTAAMQELALTDKPIIDIAIDYQFESQHSFTRAFQSRFMFPPRRFRGNKLSNPPSSKQRLSEDYLHMVEKKELTLEPEIIEIPEKTFLGMHIRSDLNGFDDKSIIPRTSELRKHFNSRLGEISEDDVVAAKGEGLLIISFRVPIEERESGDGIIVMTGIEVQSTTQPPKGMRTITVQQSKYARFVYTGALQNFYLASYYVAGSWFPKSKYWVGNAPLFSYMQVKGVNAEENKSTYYLPLRNRNDRFIDRWWEH